MGCFASLFLFPSGGGSWVIGCLPLCETFSILCPLLPYCWIFKVCSLFLTLSIYSAICCWYVYVTDVIDLSLFLCLCVFIVAFRISFLYSSSSSIKYGLKKKNCNGWYRHTNASMAHNFQTLLVLNPLFLHCIIVTLAELTDS